MNTQELQTLLQKHIVTKNNFSGVYALDKLPLIARKRAYIINFDKSCENGSHWVAILFTFDHCKPAEYFDSYGKPPQHKEIIDFLNRNSSHWIYNSKRLQSDETLVCGQYCVFYLLFRLRNFSLHKIQNMFTKHFLRNDKIVYFKIKQLMNKCIPFKFKII